MEQRTTWPRLAPLQRIRSHVPQKIGSKSVEKDAKSTPSSPEKAEEQSEAAESGGDDSMKNLLGRGK